MKIQNPKSSQGSALVVVLWVISLLSMLIIAFAFDMHIEARITSTWRKTLKAEYLAKAGIELARMALLETADPEINNADSSAFLAKGSDQILRSASWALARGESAEWTRDLGEGTVTVMIRPENARMNLNSMVNINDREWTFQTWDPLFEAAGVPAESRDTLVDCLIDWVDPNELSHLNGVESEYYERLPNPYKAKNKPLDTVDELQLVKGFSDTLPDSTQTVYGAVSEFLTTYAEDQKVNINAATEDMLMAFLDIDAPLAESIILERVGPDGKEGTEDDNRFKDENDLFNRVQGLNRNIFKNRFSFIHSGRFTIISRGKVGGVNRAVKCVVRLADNTVTILNWQEGSAF